jgi:cytochrome P450
MLPVCIPDLMAHLLSPFEKEGRLDWVEKVAKKLPAMVILTGFGFTPADSACVLTHLGNANRLMLAHPGESECKDINEALAILLPILTRHCRDWPPLKLLAHSFTDADQGLLLLASNLLGLLMQSYDAGRGLLTNALIRALPYHQPGKRNPVDVNLLGRVVGETLRFDPPIHHTRRVVAQDIVVDNRLLTKGNTVLLVLASANRDPGYFPNPHLFNPERISSHAILSFGAGIHACLARQLVVEQTTQSLIYLFTHYPEIQLPPETAGYERLMNARLRQRLQIRFK